MSESEHEEAIAENVYQDAREDKRKHNNRWVIVAMCVMAGAFALMALAASWVVVRSSNERQAICESSATERRVLRSVLIFARDSATLADGQDAVQRAAVALFYKQALERAPEVSCSNGSIERR